MSLGSWPKASGLAQKFCTLLRINYNPQCESTVRCVAFPRSLHAARARVVRVGIDALFVLPFSSWSRLCRRRNRQRGLDRGLPPGGGAELRPIGGDGRLGRQLVGERVGRSRTASRVGRQCVHRSCRRSPCFALANASVNLSGSRAAATVLIGFQTGDNGALAIQAGGTLTTSALTLGNAGATGVVGCRWRRADGQRHAHGGQRRRHDDDRPEWPNDLSHQLHAERAGHDRPRRRRRYSGAELLDRRRLVRRRRG